jgi:hypothetical protein
MSASTTFELTIAASAIDAFATALAAHVEHIGHGPESAHSQVSPAALASMIRALSSGELLSECLSFGFEIDESLKAFHDEHPDLTSIHPGKVAVGCFWTCCTLAASELAIAFSSATGSISELMRESASVRSVFRSLAVHASNGTVQVIDDWGDVSIL